MHGLDDRLGRERELDVAQLRGRGGDWRLRDLARSGLACAAGREERDGDEEDEGFHTRRIREAFGTPMRSRNISRGQKRVMPLWNRFRPTNAVSQRKCAETKMGLAATPRASETRTTAPAKIRTIRSVVMTASWVGKPARPTAWKGRASAPWGE